MITESEHKKAVETIAQYEKEQLLNQVGTSDDYLWKYALCWYPKNKYDGHELELFFCKVLTEKRGDYVTCQLYWGETFNPKNLSGVFDDVCFEDLVWDKRCFE